MKKIHTTRLSLPDGRLVKIEGGDAESHATEILAIMNERTYQGQAPVAAAAHNAIEALPVPGLSFEENSNSCDSDCSGTPRGQTAPANFPRYAPVARQVLNVPAANGAVEPLSLPTMNFEKPGSKKTTATRQAPAGIEALPLPTMNFQKI